MTGTEIDEVLELEVGSIAGGGGCVAHAPDGRVVFVRHSIPGERVMARVTASTTSFLRADAIEILTPAADRVTPPCPHAGPAHCGGCDFQHVSLEGQRRLKAFRVAEQLDRLAGLTRAVEVEAVSGDHEGLGWRTRVRLGVEGEAVSGDHEGLGWRTRVRLGVDEAGQVGFRQHRSHQLEYVEGCPIACPEVTATDAFGADWSGVEEFEVIVAPDSGDALITVDTVGRTRPPLPELGTGMVVNGRLREKPGAVHTTVAKVDFRVTAGVFWQVHVGAAGALAGAVRSAAAAQPGDKVVDLYAGAGLFSVLLAQDVGRRGAVLAVERDRRACADAEHNGRDHPQLSVKKASISPRLVELGIGTPDLVVLDPAREGAGKAVMAALSEHASHVRRLVYVSCDPASFGRDARVLLDAGWTLTSLRAFDIFPMTEHVELVAGFDPPTP